MYPSDRSTLTNLQIHQKKVAAIAKSNFVLFHIMSCVSAGCQKASLCDTNEQQNFVRSVDGDNFFLFLLEEKNKYLSELV